MDRLVQAARTRLTYANVTATLALFLAVGGISYAAFELPKGSVGSRELKRHAVTPNKIAPKTELKLGTFGDSVHEYDGVTVPRCDETPVASLDVRIKRPSMVFAYGQAEYSKVADRPEYGALSVRLFDEGSSDELARTPELTDGSINLTGWTQGINVGGILLKPKDTGSDGPAYVAKPGPYELKLIGGSYGNCGSNDPQMEDRFLSYVLLGAGA